MENFTYSYTLINEIYSFIYKKFNDDWRKGVMNWEDVIQVEKGCKDYVERKAVFLWMRKYYPKDKLFIDSIINAIPKADVQEVTHAKWYKIHEHIILADGSVKEWDNFFCSNCEEVSNCPTKYCPCCGAKIDKE